MTLAAAIDTRPGTYILVGTGLCASGKQIFTGAKLNANSSGYLTPATDSASDNGYMGIAYAPDDNSANATTPGTKAIQFGIPVSAEVKLTWSQANAGKNLYLSADDTASTSASNGIFIGVAFQEGLKGSAYTRYSSLIPRIA